MKVQEVIEQINELEKLYKNLNQKLMFYKDIENVNPIIKNVCDDISKRLTAINKMIFNYLNSEVKEVEE